MSAAQRKATLDLPLKVILTEDGVSDFISHKKKLSRFRLADNVDEHGVLLKQFSPKSIQTLLLLGYVSKMEMSLAEFVSSRQEVMDLSKIVVYSVLYKQFDKEVFTAMTQCECVREYNRKYPAKMINERTKIPETALRAQLAKKDAIINQVRSDILKPIWEGIQTNKDYSIEEKNVFMLMSEKFLNRMSLMNWYMIVIFRDEKNFSDITAAVRKNINSYMEKSKVAEYISVMIMELAINNENTNLKNKAKVMFPDEEDVNMLIMDPENRAKIVQELKRENTMVTVSWKLGGGSTSIGKQNRLQITVYNKSDEKGSSSKENLEDKIGANTKKKSLVDFYKELPEGEGGADLGMYYFSYLDEACKKVNIKFESIVNQFSQQDLTVINLIFSF